MHDIESIFEKMREGVRMGPIQVKELKEAGVPVVGTYCTYTPWELIRAAGGIAVTLCSTSEKPIAAAELHHRVDRLRADDLVDDVRLPLGVPADTAGPGLAAGLVVGLPPGRVVGHASTRSAGTSSTRVHP